MKGELAHGELGLVDDFKNWCEYSDTRSAYEFASFLRTKKRVANKLLCPCGSGIRYAKCHCHETNKYRKLKKFFIRKELDELLNNLGANRLS